MEERDAIIAEMKRLGRERPKGWFRKVRDLSWRIEMIDDPYREHVRYGNEATGRHARAPSSCPSYDRMGENSRP